MTAGDLAVIGPVVQRLAPVIREGDAGVLSIVAETPAIIEVAEHLLDCPSPVLRELPLHELVRVLEQLVVEWLEVNGPYMVEKVTPAITGLTQSLRSIAELSAAATSPAPTSPAT